MKLKSYKNNNYKFAWLPTKVYCIKHPDMDTSSLSRDTEIGAIIWLETYEERAGWNMGFRKGVLDL